MIKPVGFRVVYLFTSKVAVIDALVDEFNQENQNGETYPEPEHDKSARHIHQCQRLLVSRSLLVLHFALINSRLMNKIVNHIL